MFSFAAGYRAKIAVDHDGTFLFADSNSFDFSSWSANSFKVRATGGVRFVVGIDDFDGSYTWSCLLVAGSSWSCSSDRSLKENLTPVDGREILQRLSGVPILRWNARGQDPAVQHLGPMAQDFHTAFELGADDQHLGTIDLDGVALASIQGLYQLSQEQEDQIAVLQARVDDLEARMGALGASGGANQGDEFRLPAGPWLLAGLVVVAAVLGRRGLFRGER
jgi:hypothetical protein